MNDSYPPNTDIRVGVFTPEYQDEAAIALYKLADASTLVAAHSKLVKALAKQAEKIEEFHNTPFSAEHAKLIETTTHAIAAVELQLERWHHLIYPNQHPRSRPSQRGGESA